MLSNSATSIDCSSDVKCPPQAYRIEFLSPGSEAVCKCCGSLLSNPCWRKGRLRLYSLVPLPVLSPLPDCRYPTPASLPLPNPYILSQLPRPHSHQKGKHPFRSTRQNTLFLCKSCFCQRISSRQQEIQVRR